MAQRTIIIGTRGSKLALWQANHVKDQLASIGVPSELKIIKTQGDMVLHLRLDKLEGKGFFTKEIEEELLRGDIDLAVHSHKDLPTQNPEGLIIAAVSEREDPSELLIVRKEAVDHAKRLSLKANAKVGTSSNRRKAQLLALRPDLEFSDLRGNVITRVEKLRNENYDAIVLAKAGITRIGLDLSDFHVIELAPNLVVPAPAQGVLALQIRESDQELAEILQKINDPHTEEEIAVERRVLRLFEAGCHAPLGCYCRRTETGFEVWTSKADTAEEFPDRLYLRADAGASAESLAERIASIYTSAKPLPKRVFISRELPTDSYLRAALEKHRLDIDDRSLIRVSPVITHIEPSILQGVDWIFFTSKNSVNHFFDLKPVLAEKTKFAVIGRGSEEALRRQGHLPQFCGEEFGIDMHAIAKRFAEVADGQQVLIPRAKDTLGTMSQALTPETKLIDLPLYETALLDEVSPSDAEVLIFTSPSNAEAYFAKNLATPQQKIISIGHSTGKKLESYGLNYILPATPDEIGLAEAVFGLKA